MVVGQLRTWGTIGGGNLEQAAVVHARGLIAASTTEPETSVTRLSDRAPAQHGVQCCGGEVTLLFEPLRPVPSIAIFGVGHVGTELALVLARHDVELHLVDSRAGQLDRVVIEHAVARVHRHHAVVPELVLGELPAGSHVLIMTHDHAEDAALCDAALRCGAPGVDRVDRVGGEVGPVRAQARRRGPRRGRARPHHHPDRAARHHRASSPR